VKTAEEYLREADPQAALDVLTEQVRAKPGDPKLRIFLTQLLCVLGQWERAGNQMTVAADLDPAAIPMREMYGDAIRCEMLRHEVFAGHKAPMVFGQPEEWLALLIESLLRGGQGDHAQAASLSARAFDAAPATAGTLDGTPFEWIADADMRIGPVLEAIINGRYYWVPFAQLARIEIEAPTDLRDMIWIPAHLWFVNGGESVALIPVRYPGSERDADGQIRLSRKTEWTDAGNGIYHGLGQRLFSIGDEDRALLDIRSIALDHG
jgi:type VI secretion system protein ImpE